MALRRALLAIPSVLCACGDPAARVTLAPALSSACARPAGATALRVTAYATSGEASRGVDLDGAVSLDDLPGDTEQIGVEVLVGGGAVGASGKSAPLAFADLADGSAISIAMAPPNGLCRVGPMSEPRAQPLLAIAGIGALVVGGDGSGGPLSSAEFYDPATATFSPVDVPEVFHDSPLGLSGMALATLADGRVALTGGPAGAFTLFDPATRTFGAPITVEARRFHAAIAVAPDQVLVAGGCASLADPGCVTPRLTTRVFALATLGSPAFGPQLPAGSVRDGAQLFDTGVQLDGARRYLLAGGSGVPAGAGSRFALGDAIAADVTGLGPVVAPLDGGAIVTVFPPTDPDTGVAAAAVLAPDASAAIANAHGVPGVALDLATVRLVQLEDGRVVGFGGDASGALVAYDPASDEWKRGAPACAADACEAPVGIAAPSLLRLLDGSVLVVGGGVAADAWIYRPPTQVGARSGSVTVIPGTSGTLTVPSPTTVMRADGFVLASTGDALDARALVGGPRMASGSVRATVHVLAGGVALIAQQRGPGELVAALLAPGEPARLVRFAAGVEETLCTGETVPAFAADTPATLRLALTGHDARLTLDDTTELLACSANASEIGQWGVSALGANARVAVDVVTAAR